MPTKKDLSAQHKKAMAEGRAHAQNVKTYLEALRTANAPKKRGRRRTPEAIEARLAKIQEELADDPTALAEVQLVQERIDLQTELDQLRAGEGLDPADHEDGFIESAKPYSESKGITYAAWRELGVNASVLRRAGINR